MPEIVLPGTYIEVRAEGLISAGGVVTGNIGIVGTASKGPVDEVQLLGSLAEAREIFGESDQWIDGNNNELTLIRALELIYKNGGQAVYAVRTANIKEDDPQRVIAANFVLTNDADQLLRLEAKTPGTWGNKIKAKICNAGEGKPGKKIIEFVYNKIEESYTIENVADLVNQLNQQPSMVVEVAQLFEGSQGKLPDNTENYFGAGADGANATANDYERSLVFLENEIINILLLAGQDTTKLGMADLLQGHLKTTAGIKRERIALIGSGFKDGKDQLDDVPKNEEGRLIFTAPGILVSSNGKQNKLPGGYLAAAVAGLISSLPVQASPTNKILTLEGLTTEYNSAQLEKLVSNSILLSEKRNGFRIVKGITTASSPWNQITTRRIVDYAIYGVRSSCEPYIGKLNNERIRGAMKATLDGFLTRMVESEALVSYKLQVSATRSQEIAGESMVILILMPTFSIDFIKVTMYLS
ncbi:MAG TPA: phage tail protein [Cyanobacteria bacterium UBA12227]|nr:phage tail protein [Cyanobacteria bacterium UBA12227]HAX88810.1 phage tail protein [Cyanobacteria bacterium UBA11370]HBY79720.1 phage tail protein [Cyanobacteria bacterium UBA11148]